MLRRAALTCALLFHATGCGPYLQATGGYASSPVDPRGQRGGTLNLHAGMGLVGGESVVLAHGPNIRARATERLGGVSLGHDFTLRYIVQTQHEATTSDPPLFQPMEVYLRVGNGVVGFGAFDGDFSFTAMSPFVEYGLVVMHGNEDVPYFTLGAAIEHDMRWSSQPRTSSVSFLLGVGFLKLGRADNALMSP